MSSNRIHRINDEIQRELASQIRNLKDPRVSGMVSITRVDTTNDLRYARVYVSVLEKTREADVLKGLSFATPLSSNSPATTPSSTAPTSWSSCARRKKKTPPAALRRRNDHAHHTPDRRPAAVL